MEVFSLVRERHGLTMGPSKGGVDMDLVYDLHDSGAMERQYGRNFNRDEFEKLIEWGQQWLTENPKKVERWLLVCEGGDDYVYDRREELDEHLKEYSAEPVAIVPISYRIGEGLSTEGEDNE